MTESSFIDQSKLRFNEGDIVFRKGEMAQRMYIVLNGKIRLYLGHEPVGDWSLPNRDDGCDDSGSRQHGEDGIERLKIFFAECVVDQVFQAERHDDVEQRLHEQSDADENEPRPVLPHMRPGKAPNGRERAGRLTRRIDDEILVVVIVVDVVRIGRW